MLSHTGSLIKRNLPGRAVAFCTASPHLTRFPSLLENRSFPSLVFLMWMVWRRCLNRNFVLIFRCWIIMLNWNCFLDELIWGSGRKRLGCDGSSFSRSKQRGVFHWCGAAFRKSWNTFCFQTIPINTLIKWKEWAGYSELSSYCYGCHFKLIFTNTVFANIRTYE